MYIHQDQLRAPFLPASDGFLAVIRATNGKANGAQHFHQPVPVLNLIVDDQNSGSFPAGSDAYDAASRTPPDGHSGVAPFARDLEPKRRAIATAADERDIAPHQARVLTANG